MYICIFFLGLESPHSGISAAPVPHAMAVSSGRRHAYVSSTVTFSKMEGDDSDMNLTCVLRDGETDGLCYHWKWKGIEQTSPIVSGATSALRFPASFKNLDHCNATLSASGCSFGYKDKPKPVAARCCQGEETRVALAERETMDQSSQHAHRYFDKTPVSNKGDNMPVANFVKPRASYEYMDEIKEATEKTWTATTGTRTRPLQRSGRCLVSSRSTTTQ